MLAACLSPAMPSLISICCELLSRVLPIVQRMVGRGSPVAEHEKMTELG